MNLKALQVESSTPSAILFSEDQINLFETRYDNDIMMTKCMQHGYNSSTLMTSLQNCHWPSAKDIQHFLDEEQAEQPNFTTVNPDPTDNCSHVSDSVIAANDNIHTAISKCFSQSFNKFGQYQKVCDRTSELLGEGKPSPKKGNKAKLTDRVLTNTKSLALLIEKEKKEEEEQKAKRSLRA